MDFSKQFGLEGKPRQTVDIRLYLTRSKSTLLQLNMPDLLFLFCKTHSTATACRVVGFINSSELHPMEVTVCSVYVPKQELIKKNSAYS